MEAIVRTAVVAFLAIWLLLSVLTVARVRWLSGRRRWDVFQLLSSWRLFVASDGARPSTFPLLIRDRTRNGRLLPPVAYSTGAIEWSPLMIFWSRDWDRELLLRRLCKEIRKHRQGPRPPAYWHLLHAVRREVPAATDAEARQFIVLETHGVRGEAVPRQIFSSDFHAL